MNNGKVTTSDSFTNRIIKWNADRRKPEFNYELCRRLLIEESGELFQANTLVDKCDAIGDIVFVAVGELWKLGFEPEQIYEIFYHNDLRKFTHGESVDWGVTVKAISFDILDHEIPASYAGLDLAISSVFNIAIPALIGAGMQEMFYEILHAICDSNDTKEIVKVGSDVKSSKGAGFIPPTKRLVDLCNMQIVKKSKN